MKNAFVSSNELKVENDIFDPFRGDMNLIVRELIKNISAMTAQPTSRC